MTLKLRTDLDLAGVPVVTLAGVEYFVPPLAFRQLRKVVPALMKLRPVLDNFHGDFSLLDEQVFDDLFALVVATLSRAYPEVQAQDLIDLLITPAELLAAVAVIAPQTGLFTASAAPSPEPAPGEAIPQTSTN